MSITSPEQIAKLGEEIYEKNKESLERDSMGKFLAINVETEALFIADTPEEASRKAKEANPDAVSFLTKIGPDRGIFTSRTCRGAHDSWPLSFGFACH